jgi:hypothetical protein
MANARLTHKPTVDLDRHLNTLSTYELRILKLHNSDATIGSVGHKILHAADRILRTRDGIYIGIVL